MIPASSLAKEESNSDDNENDDHDVAKIKKKKPNRLHKAQHHNTKSVIV